VRTSYESFDFNRVQSALFNFCTNELSAFYFDIRKDVLYCDRTDSVRRRSVRTVMDETFRCIVTWFAPILCFTMEEVWTTRFGMEASVHLHDFHVPAQIDNPGLFSAWDEIRKARSVVTGALEIARSEKKIGSSLEAAPIVYADGSLLAKVPFAEILITSGVQLRDLKDAPPDAFQLPNGNVQVVFSKALGEKCARCWMVLEEVKAHPDTHLCNRCTDAVGALEPA
jgi:isoleucyl-tRNA synthetase